MHGRMYDPYLGQFLSPDPVMQAPFSQGFNRFAYAFNSPHNYTDPSGFTANPEAIGSAIGFGVLTVIDVALLSGGTSTSVGAGVGVGALASGASLAGLGTAASGATGAGLVFSTAILSGLHPASVAPRTVQASSRSAVMASQGSPSLGRTNTAMGTSTRAEPAPPVPKPAGNSEWWPTPDLSNTAGAHDPAPSVPNKILSNKEFKIEDTSETWKSLFEAVTIFVPGAGETEAGAVLALKGASALAKIELNIGVHAAKQMAERGISQSMIKVALEKGTRFIDPKNGTINYVLKKGFASGKDLLVGTNPLTGKITTVIRGVDLVRPRFIPFAP